MIAQHQHGSLARAEVLHQGSDCVTLLRTDVRMRPPILRDERHQLFAELDDLSEELVRRYREQQPSESTE